jgi:ATP-dependent RNA helicase RhlE
VRRLAKDVLGDPTRVQVGETAPATTVSHAIYPVPQQLKTSLLLELLRHTDTESVLVFTRTKHRAKRLGDQLKRAGYKATSVQGTLSQNQRQAALDGFRSGKFQIMVATDIAARGIDVSSISHVINYDIPDTAEAYTHRIGRTGRAAKTGDAFTLVTSEDTDMVKTIERILGSKLERRTVEGFDYNAPPPPRDSQPQRPEPSSRPARSPRPGRQPQRGQNSKPGNGNRNNANNRNSNQNNKRRPEGSQPRPSSGANPPPPTSNDPYPYVSRLASDLPSQQAGYKSKVRPKGNFNRKRRPTR